MEITALYFCFRKSDLLSTLTLPSRNRAWDHRLGEQAALLCSSFYLFFCLQHYSYSGKLPLKQYSVLWSSARKMRVFMYRWRKLQSFGYGVYWYTGLVVAFRNTGGIPFMSFGIKKVEYPFPCSFLEGQAVSPYVPHCSLDPLTSEVWKSRLWTLPGAAVSGSQAVPRCGQPGPLLVPHRAKLFSTWQMERWCILAVGNY